MEWIKRTLYQLSQPQGLTRNPPLNLEWGNTVEREGSA